MTQLIKALADEITKEMIAAAANEDISPENIKDLIKKGEAVLTHNINHKDCRSVAVGKNLKTKVNANIGTSKEHCNIDEELKKVDVAIEAGSDTIMDLSTGGDLDKIRQIIINHSTIPVGTVPIYQSVVELLNDGKQIPDLTENKILDVIERHAKSGVDFITIHSGLTMRAIKRMDKENRIMNVVSRGGSFIVNWVINNNKENPFFTAFDKILKIAKEYDITLSLGDGLRPGCLHDATDSLQIDELLVLGELRDRAFDAGVQAMIEGPGHVPLSEIKANILLQKKICKGAPFYVLGPLPTDISPGYDHITGAIGGAIAASAGADFLCFLTASEHLRLPTIEDVREGVVATRIAAHIGDIEKGIKSALEKDNAMAKARVERDWSKMYELAIDPVKAKEYHNSSLPKTKDVCTMCGDLCSMKISEKTKKSDKDKNLLSEAPTL